MMGNQGDKDELDLLFNKTWMYDNIPTFVILITKPLNQDIRQGTLLKGCWIGSDTVFVNVTIDCITKWTNQGDLPPLVWEL